MSGCEILRETPEYDYVYDGRHSFAGTPESRFRWLTRPRKTHARS